MDSIYLIAPPNQSLIVSSVSIWLIYDSRLHVYKLMTEIIGNMDSIQRNGQQYY